MEIRENGMIIVDGVLKSGKDCTGDVVVPAGVSRIADMAFYTNKNITSITINEGCRELGKYICNQCPSLEWIKVPASVEKMDNQSLIKKIEREAGFTHTMQTTEYYPRIITKEGSYTDTLLKKLISKDGWVDSHSNQHVVEISYE